MNRKKKRFVTLILVLIIITSFAFIALDWLPLINPGMALHANIYSDKLKALVILMTTILVFITGKDCLNKKDSIMMKAIYVLIIIADSALVLLDSPVTGVLFFCFAQLGLIFRNSVNMKEKLMSGSNDPLKSRLYIITIQIVIFYIFIFITLLNTPMNQKLLSVMMAVYSFIVLTSFWTAYANYLLRLFPKINSVLVSLGMFFFLLCDINVGLSWILPVGLSRSISSGLIWVFYTPALTLIALSGYNLKQQTRL